MSIDNQNNSAVTITDSGDKVVIKIHGVLDYKIRDEFRELYSSEKKYKDYIVDLEETEFIPSSGLGLLIALYGRTKATDDQIKISIINCSPNIKQILEISKFGNYFSKYSVTPYL